ncbi:ATP-binding cassette domain-containing protein [Kaistella flava (ex Peng et al. 2021)]|uniref:ATP-binding cassette domain-containing protein n=1 Tax=Kaistella flava (ex Peng et al. 2021) TaxID=2038776 RepID=A0A7M2Y8A7_9FLAO|nr:ATP-binding cassette domain-containing protein [Kaistella flava (ex Peng et al. 2021)]QOW09573.1 ATP-binding cassette domain-containing protein [Kaistella flava (ex Peng et al. 2021)]
MSILETKNLTRLFGTFTAVDGLDITIERGEIFALLGPNGAGKSTVIKMLTTLLPPTSGDAFINGFSIKTQTNEIRKIIGYVPQMISADGSLTGYENLSLFAKLYDIPRNQRKERIKEAINFMGLADSAYKLVKEYSGGMIRRLEIAQSTLHRPPILFLDEPTTGLDPIGRNTVWEHISALQKQYSTTIVMTTHLMEEADGICNRVALMARGKLSAIGTPEGLKASIGKEGATLEDVFIHYTADNLGESGSNFRNVSIERKTTGRLG